MEFRNYGDEQEEENRASDRRGRTKHHRHTPYQIQQLEASFKQCPHPDENQRIELAYSIGLQPRQVKFWFQNKRTQSKTQNERADFHSLRADNERIKCENMAIQEAIKNVLCQDCGGPPPNPEERKNYLKNLELENAELKKEHERVSALLSKFIGRPIAEIEKLVASGASPRLLPRGCSLTMDPNPEHGHASTPSLEQEGTAELEKRLMMNSIAGAFGELMQLLRVEEPTWIKSDSGEGLTLHRYHYEKTILGRVNHMRSSDTYAHSEASKHSGIVSMSASKLVDMFLDSSQWADLFPTIITKAQLIATIEEGKEEGRDGSLKLMYGKFHVLSPLVPSREISFLRHCKHIEDKSWVITDVSYDYSKETLCPSPNTWKLPSGCLIQDLSNGCSKVTWIEHVQVDDGKVHVHKMYRDLVYDSFNLTYGALKWIATLQRMCDRISFAHRLPPANPPTHDHDQVVAREVERGGLLKLSHRMVKMFNEMLSSSGDKLDFPQLAEVNSSGVRVAVHKSTEVGQPSGMIVITSTSFWLPFSPQAVFDAIADEESRVEWDVLCNGRSLLEIRRIATGGDPANCISIRRPFIPTENNIAVLEETFTDAAGSIMMIYAPLDGPGFEAAAAGDDTSEFQVLPSGLVVSGDGRARRVDRGGASSSRVPPPAPKGSLVTVAFQILVSDRFSMESVATVNALISSTAQKIKASVFDRSVIDDHACFFQHVDD